jgi:hypothetical protein
LLLLDGSSSLIAFGLTSVEVSMKKINNRNTRSDIDAILKAVLILFLDFIAILVDLHEKPFSSGWFRMPAREADP